MKSSLLSVAVVAMQAACLTQAHPLLEAQTPNDILAAGIQSLPSPSVDPGTIGVSLSLLTYALHSLLIASGDHSCRT